MIKYVAVHGFYYPSISKVNFKKAQYLVKKITFEKETDDDIFINGIGWSKTHIYYTIFDTEKEAILHLKDRSKK